MKTIFLRVKKCGVMTTVQSEKSENGVLNKRTKPRHRGKPVFKGMWSSLSFAADGNDYVIFKVPNSMRYMLHKILQRDINKIISYLKKEGWSK
jgi:hypothetical protein